MKRLSEILVILAFVMGLSALQSCSNLDDDTVKDDTVVKTDATDYANLIGAYTLSDVDEALSTDESGELTEEVLKSTDTRCFTITIEPNDDGLFWPRSWTVDFGDSSCVCACGHTRTGKIHVTLSDFWRNEGSLREMTFDNFYFDGNKIEGVKTILNTGLNDAGNMTFLKKLTDGKVTYADGTSMTWNCEKVAELIEGGDTFLFADDVWSVTGGGSGVDIDGNNFTLTITEPLIYKNGCFYPVSGIVTIETEGAETKTIDYGDGECDNLITVTVGDVTEEVEL
ncbi:MAG: hypothetical protein GXO47_07080 [Chlorobi bacterium]|nr:hypothetical protein [Chlorobiota bacterium]